MNDIYVAPWARVLGLGRRLMARVCRLAIERDCCRVEHRVLRDNPAQSFYEGIGLAATSERTSVVRDQGMRDLAEQ